MKLIALLSFKAGTQSVAFIYQAILLSSLFIHTDFLHHRTVLKYAGAANQLRSATYIAATSVRIRYLSVMADGKKANPFERNLLMDVLSILTNIEVVVFIVLSFFTSLLIKNWSERVLNDKKSNALLILIYIVATLIGIATIGLQWAQEIEDNPNIEAMVKIIPYFLILSSIVYYFYRLYAARRIFANQTALTQKKMVLLSVVSILPRVMSNIGSLLNLKDVTFVEWTEIAEIAAELTTLGYTFSNIYFLEIWLQKSSRFQMLTLQFWKKSKVAHKDNSLTGRAKKSAIATIS